MKPRADVCFLLEGTYPYVRGGVSSWVHQLISELSELRFALVFVGGSRAELPDMQYELPDNVVHLEAHFLRDAPAPQRGRGELAGASVAAVHDFHEAFKRGRTSSGTAPIDSGFARLLTLIERPGGVALEDFLFSRGAWDFACARYRSEHSDAPFLDFFWTVRLMHGPVFQLARISQGAPEARVYHTVSTGYAGLLGALIERSRKRPLILSEHGIYTKERAIDLNQADWLDPPRSHPELGLEDPPSCARELWIRYFEGLGKLTYQSADPIVALSAQNQRRQHRDGADPAKTCIVANGVDVDRFCTALRARPSRPPRVIGLVGRVVPIKDVKTFIRAIGRVAEVLPDVEGWVVGGADEEPAYAQECWALARDLGLERKLRFLGQRDVREVFPQLGLLMLSSISEAQPLAVLEAFASGLPCVTTDVGACREQIEGLAGRDRALGRAGRVVPFGDSDALARAAIELLTDGAAWSACQRTALARVQTSYNQAAMIEAYRAIYRRAMEG